MVICQKRDNPIVIDDVETASEILAIALVRIYQSGINCFLYTLEMGLHRSRTTELIFMETAAILNSRIKRFVIASLLWFVSWPIIYYFKIGEITGAKAWFWIVGEINYPIVAVAYFLLDQVCERFGMKPNIIFLVSVVVIMICMPYYYKHYGFPLGVTIEARYL